MKKNLIKHLLSFLSVAVFIILLIGSANQKPLPPSTPLKIGQYSFKPPFTAEPKSAGIAFCVVHPRYAENFAWSGMPVFKKFADAMGADVEQLVVARGYSIRGPFETWDEIVYSDKVETDLGLEVKIELNISSENLKVLTYTVTHGFGNYATYTYYYKIQGDFVLDGKIIMNASETQTHEKLWSKSIPLPQETLQGIAGEKRFDHNPTLNDALSDPILNNAIVDVLEKYYKTIMQTAWNHLVPAELETLKPQVKAIKAKAVNVNH